MLLDEGAKCAHSDGVDKVRWPTMIGPHPHVGGRAYLYRQERTMTHPIIFLVDSCRWVRSAVAA